MTSRTRQSSEVLGPDRFRNRQAHDLIALSQEWTENECNELLVEAVHGGSDVPGP